MHILDHQILLTLRTQISQINVNVRERRSGVLSSLLDQPITTVNQCIHLTGKSHPLVMCQSPVKIKDFFYPSFFLWESIRSVFHHFLCPSAEFSCSPTKHIALYCERSCLARCLTRSLSILVV